MLNLIQKQYELIAKPHWISVGTSKLCLSYAVFAIKEIKLLHLDGQITAKQLKVYISKHCVHDWQGVYDVNGKEIKFSRDKLTESFRDVEFLKLIVKLVFDKSNFVGDLSNE